MKQMQIDFEKISQHFNSKASAPWTWVFYGDSITHGAAHTHGFRAFPEIFAERVRWEMRFLYDAVINTGISGQTTVQLLDEDNTCTEIPFEKRVTLKRNSVLLLTSK